MIRVWEERYGPFINELEVCVAEESKGDSTGRLWLSQLLVVDRLCVLEIACNSAINASSSSVEETVFQLSGPHETTAVPLGAFL